MGSLDYEEQLKKKELETLDCMRNMFAGIKNAFSDRGALPSCFSKVFEDDKLKGVHLDWHGILASPKTEGYRNNCEFTCGYNSEKKPSVGFRQGLYSQGIINVESPQEVRIVSESAKKAVQILQLFIEAHHDTHKVCI